jgi:serine/threonine protein kinase
MSNHYTRYLQWKFIEINGKIKMEDFVIHRIIGRGGFGEVYAGQKIDTGEFENLMFSNFIFLFTIFVTSKVKVVV